MVRSLRTNRLARTVVAITSGLAVTLGAVVATSPSSSALTFPPADHIAFTSVVTPSVPVPVTPGTPTYYLQANTPFNVTADFLDPTGKKAPLSYLLPVSVTVSAVTANGTITLATQQAPPGSTSIEFDNLTLGTVGTVTLHMQANRLLSPASGDTPPIEMHNQTVTAPGDTTQLSVGAGGGIGQDCQPTPAQPTCGVLLLPKPGGTTTNELLALSDCDPSFNCPVDRLIVTWLVGLTPGVYKRNAPAKLIYKCDQTACVGTGVNTFHLAIQLKPSDPVTDTPACAVAGKIDATLHYCIDYANSFRDSQGDLNLVLLFIADGRISIPKP